MKSIPYSEFLGVLKPAFDYLDERRLMADAFLTLVGEAELFCFSGADRLLDSYVEAIAQILDADPEIISAVVFGRKDPTEAYEALRKE